MTNRLYAPLSVPGVRGGSPLTLDRAIDVLEMYIHESEQLENQYYHALDRYEAVKTKAAKVRWHDRLDELQAEFSKFHNAIDALENSIDEYTTALVPPEEPDRQPEWQFGLEYEASRRGGHNVDLNVNIRRKDGATFTADEAKEAMRYRIARGAFPAQYRVAEIVYRSPDSNRARGRVFRDGGYDPESLDESFNSVIISTKLAEWRVGGIEE